MKAIEAAHWDFSAPITDESIIKCGECFVESPISLWTDGEAYCEDCGTHAAMICPVCEEYFDHVYAGPFQVK